MPRVSLDVTGTTDRLPVIESRRMDTGHIFSLACILTEGDTQTGRCHVQAGIALDPPTEQTVIAILIDDYVYPGHSPSWTGKFPLEEGDNLIVIIRSADAVTCRLVGRTLKYDP